MAIIRYLIEHGASLFLATGEGETPHDIAKEEHRLVLDEPAHADMLSATSECLHYLKGQWCHHLISSVISVSSLCCVDMEQGLGQLNGGVVFALFSRPKEEEEELSLSEGEKLVVMDAGMDKWWKARNGRGQIGLVPSTYLGLYKRVQDIL